MNGFTHKEYAQVVAHLIVHDDLAPGAARWLSEHVEQFVDAAALPDQVNEVACEVPEDGATSVQVELLGHNLSSFTHFEPGYRLLVDPSLSVAGPVASGLIALAGLRVVANDSGTLPPLSGLLEPTPMQTTVQMHPGASLGGFLFPAASEGADYYARAARYWAGEANGAGWRRCAGYALHLVQDACVPHHAWGAILYGHQSWEDALEGRWHKMIVDTVAAKLVDSSLLRAVRRELKDLAGVGSAGEICTANADWARRHFGGSRDLPDCPGDEALLVSVRALAASVRACELCAPPT